jgi:hypothetical protein
MDEKTISLKTPATATSNLGWYLPWLGLLLGVFLVVGLVMTRLKQQPDLPQVAGDLISAQTLADQYGVRVNLIAITAAGGLVDFRLKILDAEKAKLLLQDSGDVPKLLVGDGLAVLTAPEDSTGQLLNSLADDGNVFLMYPNLQNVVKLGMPVTVQFGDIGLEPITVK